MVIEMFAAILLTSICCDLQYSSKMRPWGLAQICRAVGTQIAASYYMSIL
jgi:hypothetical protein